MKNIKLLFIELLVFALGTVTVFAEGPKAESSLVSVDGTALYEKGNKTESTVEGVTFDVDSLTLTITSLAKFEHKDGIKIYDMGDDFKIVIDGEVSYELNERNDGMFIKDTTVTMNQINNGSLTIKLEEGSGIIVEGEGVLHIGDVGLNVKSVRFKEGKVDVLNTAQVSETVFYLDGQEVELSTITKENTDVETPAETPTNYEDTAPRFKRRDSFKDVAVYAIIAGLLVVGGVVVLFITAKNQKK